MKVITRRTGSGIGVQLPSQTKGKQAVAQEVEEEKK